MYIWQSLEDGAGKRGVECGTPHDVCVLRSHNSGMEEEATRSERLGAAGSGTSLLRHLYSDHFPAVGVRRRASRLKASCLLTIRYRQQMSPFSLHARRRPLTIPNSK